MNKTNKILLAIVLILLVVLLAFLFSNKIFGGPSYYAVFLRTGDLYFGQLHTFPSFGLSDIYLLQANPNDQQNPFSIRKFSNVFWGPDNFMKINKDNVVWIVKLSDSSQLLNIIKTNPNLLPSNTQPNANNTPSTPPTKTPNNTTNSTSTR
ncbi:MAG: hypothetical protein ACP5IC_02625 [Minisyncoccia bacterium]